METRAQRQPTPHAPPSPPHPSGLWEGAGISCLLRIGVGGAVDSACVDAESCDVFAHGHAFLILLLLSLCFSLVLSKSQGWPYFYPLERQGNNLTRSRPAKPAKPAENSSQSAHQAGPRVPRSLTGKMGLAWPEDPGPSVARPRLPTPRSPQAPSPRGSPSQGSLFRLTALIPRCDRACFGEAQNEQALSYKNEGTSEGPE